MFSTGDLVLQLTVNLLVAQLWRFFSIFIKYSLLLIFNIKHPKSQPSKTRVSQILTIPATMTSLFALMASVNPDLLFRFSYTVLNLFIFPRCYSLTSPSPSPSNNSRATGFPKSIKSRTASI